MTTGGDPIFLRSLNDAQRRAVLHDSGPLAVLAGPGTGKTRVIIHRVARAVAPREQGGLGASPESVLALAFTIKSAEELRQRLASMFETMGLGVGAAERVRAMTVHSFGSQVVRRFADRLGLPREVKVMDSAQQRRMLRSLVAEHDLFRSQAATGREAALDEAIGFISACRDDSVTTQRCAEWVARRESLIAKGLDPEHNGADGQPSPADADRTAALRAALPAQRDMARLFGLYDDRCLREGRITLDDFVALPVRLLRNDPASRAILRDEFRHIVVDEFQDWNVAQIELLTLLAPVARETGAPSDVCVVGDDDQAIYGFRGADDRAFARFASHYPNSTTVALTENYRSAPVIIETANAIIERASSRFDESKTIVAGRPDHPGFADARVEGVEHDPKAGESDGAAIAAMILHDRAEATDRDEPRPWNAYAVIARSGSHLDQIGAELAVQNIPTARRERSGALEDEFVKDLLAWIEALTDPRCAPGAGPRRMLTRPPVGVPLDDVIRYEREHRVMVEQSDETRGYLEWLTLAHRTDPRIGRFVETWDALRAFCAEHPADVAIDQICRRAIFPALDLLETHDRLRSGTRLARFVAFVRAKQPNLDAPGDLREWRAYFNDLDEKERERLSDSGENALRAPDDDAGEGVQLLTAHAAKGLEFDTVFLPRVWPSQGTFPSTNADGKAPLPPDLRQRGDSIAADEERRLFYVACTRAERRLVLLAKAKKGKTTTSKMGDYFLELAYNAGAGIRAAVVSAGDLMRRAGVEPAPVVADDQPTDADRSALLDRAERSYREEAAELLFAAGSADADENALQRVDAGLSRAARRMAAIAKIRASGLRIDAAGSLAEGDERLRRLLERVVAGARGPERLRPMQAPLFLSYSKLADFERCPRCFYVKYELELDEARTTELSMGHLAHLALDNFYRERRAAEADGRFPPGKDRLLELGRIEYERSEASRAPGGRVIREQLLAQLVNAMDKLHDDSDQVLHTELQIRMPFRLEGDAPGARPHLFTAKIDRVDLAPGGGFRVIDYKTGKATKTKLEIKNDDLQMALYALAVSWWSESGAQRDPDEALPLSNASPMGEAVRLGEIEPIPGVAEYWVLSTGQRGVIGFDALNLKKVVKTVEGYAAKMLAGEYKKGSDRDCKGLCDYLGG
ncbi:MAG: ATP-dependent helicase [Phycisphaeraceae bacterium]|nr:ATP-dependent helicase [Phycisphaeraceae bacterium]